MQSQNTTTCSILGCGWLGLPLAQLLIEEGFEVKGSTTREEKLQFLSEQGIKPYRIHLYPDRIEGDITDFLNSDVLVLNFPPGRGSRDVAQNFPATIRQLLKEVEKSPIRHTLFVSSTAVYGTPDGEVTEATPPSPERASALALVEVEDVLRKGDFSTTILRFAGLVGYNRKPGRFLAGRSNLGNGNTPVNLVHQDDCIRVISEVIKQGTWGETFNVCADQHPTRKEFYTFAATHQGLDAPIFIEENQDESYGKYVSNEKLKSTLHFEFNYPDPFEMVE